MAAREMSAAAFFRTGSGSIEGPAEKLYTRGMEHDLLKVIWMTAPADAGGPPMVYPVKWIK